jgi:hypothetical protein
MQIALTRLAPSRPGLSPQVGFIDLRQLQCGTWAGPSSAAIYVFVAGKKEKTWMPGSADKFTQSAQA